MLFYYGTTPGVIRGGRRSHGSMAAAAYRVQEFFERPGVDWHISLLQVPPTHDPMRQTPPENGRCRRLDSNPPVCCGAVMGSDLTVVVYHRSGLSVTLRPGLGPPAVRPMCEVSIVVACRARILESGLTCRRRPSVRR